MVIGGCKDRRTERFLAGERIAAFQAFAPAAAKALTRLQAATVLNDLRNPPSNRFEALHGDRTGQYSIRIAAQYRVYFTWEPHASGPPGTDTLLTPGHAYDVEITDYHSPANPRDTRPMAHPIDNFSPIHPGSLLRDELAALGVSARKFAERIHVPHNAVTGIMNGQRAISARMAVRLGLVFGTTPGYWLNLQSIYDLKRALAEMPVDALAIEAFAAA